MNLKFLFLFIFIIFQKNNFSLQKDSIFNKKSFSSYLEDSTMVLMPSALLIGLGYSSAYLIEKIIEKALPKKYKRINKNIIRTMYGLLMLPGISIFLRSGLWNFINVFTRTRGFDPYNKKSKILEIKPILEKEIQNEALLELDKFLILNPSFNGAINSDHPKHKEFTKKYYEIYNNLYKKYVGKKNSKTLFVYTHGSGGSRFANIFDTTENSTWRTSEKLKNNIKNDVNTNTFSLENSNYQENIFSLKWAGDLSDETIRLTGERLSKEIDKIIKEKKYEKVVFIGHSNGGRIMIEAANDFKNKNNFIPIEIFTFSTPMTDDITSRLYHILKNENNKWIGSFAPSDPIAQYDPFAGITSISKFGTGVNDQRYIDKYGIPQNTATFMFWLKDENNNFFETNHINYVFEEENGFIQKTKFINSMEPMGVLIPSFFDFYKATISNFQEYSGKRNASVILA